MHRTLLARAAGLALVVMSVAASPALAAPKWLDAEFPFGDVPAPEAVARAAMAPDGRLVFARFAFDGALQVRERPPGGPIGPTITLPPVTVDPQPFPNLQVLAGADGTAAVLFDAGAIRYASMRPPDGNWSDPAEIGISGAGQAAIAPDGVLWRVGRAPDNVNALAVTQLEHGGRLQLTPLPAPAAGALDLAPVLAIPRAGIAHVAYLQVGVTAAGEACTRTTTVLQVDVPARGDAGPATTLDTFRATGTGTADACPADQGDTVLSPLLFATDATGADTAVYSVLSFGSFTVTPFARHRERGGVWPATAQPAEVVGDDVVAEKLVGGPGAPLVVVRTTAGKSIATRGDGGAWTPLQSLIGFEGARSFEAARTGTGTTVFAWVEGAAPARVVGRVSGADGVLGDSFPINAAGAGATMLAVGGDAEGNAAALYTQPRGDAHVLRMNGYDAAGPRPTALTVPERGATGEPLEFSVAGLDVWSGPVASADWDFGDGERATGLAASHAYASGGPRTVRARLEDDSENATTLSRELTITGPPTAPPPATPEPTATPEPPTTPQPSTPPPTVRDARAPVVRGVSISPTRVRAGRPAALALTTDEAGRLQVTLARVAPGVRSGGRCVARSRTRSRGPRCTRTLARRSLARSLAAGTQRVPLPRLAAGTWTVTAIVTDAAGNASRPGRVNLHVAT